MTDKNLILVDTSYTSFYRFFATLRWYSLTNPDDYKLNNNPEYNWFDNQIFIEKYEITIFSIKLKVGLLISKLISFFLIVFVIYNIWKLSELKINFSTPNTIKSADKIGINVSSNSIGSDGNVGININTK